MKKFPPFFFSIFSFLSIASCASSGASADSRRAQLDSLSNSIVKIAAAYPGEIGAAVIINDKDTVAVNDRNAYPMMSVFKMHQAIALCEAFDRKGISLDSVISFSRQSLDPHTWSPMLKEHPEEQISLPVRELLRSTLTQSDNNASNLMFGRLVGISSTDSLIAAIIPRSSFRIAYTEHEMAADHAKAYINSTSPLGAAALINRLFTDLLISSGKQLFLMQTLGECTTGRDRISAPLARKEGVKVAHKTGSGYSDGGILAAHNDAAFITLPSGEHYSLAVFVKDLKGDEAMASEAISRISEEVYRFIEEHPRKQ